MIWAISAIVASVCLIVAYSYMSKGCRYTLEGVTRTGHVVEVCRKCENRRVFLVGGGNVQKLMVKPEHWEQFVGEVLDGEIQTEPV